MSGMFGEMSAEEREGLMAEFLTEGGGYLQTLNEKLVEAEGAAKEGKPISEDCVNELFRMAHNIKGMASFVGLNETAALTHELENLLSKLRSKEIPLDVPTAEALFGAFDFLESQFKNLKGTGSELGTGGEVLKRIKGLVSSEAAQSAAPAPEDAQEEKVNERYLDKFIEDAEQCVDTFNETLLAYEADKTRIQPINELFRLIHTIKGSGGLINARRLAKVAHCMENILSYLRETKRQADAEVIALLFSGIDVIKDMLSLYKSSGSAAYDVGPICGLLDDGYRKLTSDEQEAAPQPHSRPVQAEELIDLKSLPAEVRQECLRAAKEELGVFHVLMELEENVPMKSLKALIAQERLKKLGRLLLARPELDDSVTEFRVPVAMLLVSSANEKEIRSALNISGLAAVSIERVDSKTLGEAKAGSPAAQARPQAGAKTAGGIELSTIRIDSHKLDNLMNLSGELVIVRARFAQIANSFSGEMEAQKENAAFLGQIRDCAQSVRKEAGELLLSAPGHGFAKTGGGKFQSALAELDAKLAALYARLASNDIAGMIHSLEEMTGSLEKISSDIQSGVMQTRMIPIEGIFTRFKRIVRDISKSLSKEADFVIEGEETELDKKIVDSLSDPLTHMLRNAVGHGLESAQERIAAGKPPLGKITLKASHKGNSIWIEVQDDGRGIDKEKIAQAALKKGIISEAEAEKMSARDKLNLIFLPGFSTAEQVTGLSGRGVGMDVVKNMINSVNGTVEVETEPGKGTTFILKIPLTLAIIKALLVTVGEEIFAFPLESVTEIVKVPLPEIYSVDGTDTIKLREHALSLADLRGALGIKAPAVSGLPCVPGAYGAVPGLRHKKVVVISDGGRKMGVEVDSLVGEDEIVIKALTEHFSGVKGITGASILGDGRIALILDPAAIIERTR